MQRFRTAVRNAFVPHPATRSARHGPETQSEERRDIEQLVGIDEGRMHSGTLYVRDDGPDHRVHLTLEPVGRANDPGGRGSASVR